VITHSKKKVSENTFKINMSDNTLKTKVSTSTKKELQRRVNHEGSNWKNEEKLD
jgi:hypothetical protein